MTTPLGWRDLSGAAPARARVLVVDDDPNIRRTVSAAVAQMGHEVKTAASAEEADRWLQVETADLVLLDIDLPRMNGVELLQWILRRQPDLAVIMLTGIDDPEVALECIDHGARTYLVKPPELDFLTRAVKDALAVGALLRERNRLAAQLR